VVDGEGSTAFVRGLVIGRSSARLFARELQRFLTQEGLEGVAVETRMGTFRNGYLTHVNFSGRLTPSGWERVAEWSRSRFPRLHADYAITQQLSKLDKYGVTGEEGYEREIA